MEQRIADIDFDALTAGRTFLPSPAAWEDEVLYFLMLDRFSDGSENGFWTTQAGVTTSRRRPIRRPGQRHLDGSRQAALDRGWQQIRGRHASRA
jgi:hypothetical protein